MTSTFLRDNFVVPVQQEDPMAKKYEYNYDTSFTYQGKRYRIRANTLEELYTKKANKLRDLKENVITYDSNVN